MSMMPIMVQVGVCMHRLEEAIVEDTREWMMV